MAVGSGKRAVSKQPSQGAGASAVPVASPPRSPPGPCQHGLRPGGECARKDGVEGVLDSICPSPALSSFSPAGPRRERSRRGRKRRAGGHRRHGHHRRRRSGDVKRRGRRYSSSSSDGFSCSSATTSASSGSWRRSSRRSSRPQRRSRRREVQRLSVDQEQLSQVVPPAGPVEEVQAVVPVPRQVAEGPSGVGGTSGSGSRRPQVWILGHSYVHWAAVRAGRRPLGPNLGLSQADVHWRGVRGLRWVQLLPEVVAVTRHTYGPVVLIIHAGGNYIGQVKMAELLSFIRTDLARFQDLFARCVVVWSEIVARTVWRGARNMAALERVRKLINVRVSRFIRSIGGIGLRHQSLEGDNADLLAPDGVHLNDIGLDIFLLDLLDGAERGLALLGGGGRGTE
ncbi:uncharacterized protein LOC142750546 [Rhinoderma darwinii]|uniref:uncharacterized protein LOC142750546 n=1 Tax=Rhinoderma darwinii TaxID=43563 RepID=UPI003F66B63E